MHSLRADLLRDADEMGITGVALRLLCRRVTQAKELTVNAPTLQAPPAFAHGLWNLSTAALMEQPRCPRPLLEPAEPPRVLSAVERQLIDAINHRVCQARRLLETRPSFPWTGPEPGACPPPRSPTPRMRAASLVETLPRSALLLARVSHRTDTFSVARR